MFWSAKLFLSFPTVANKSSAQCYRLLLKISPTMSEILVGEYLFRRLKEIGIETIFGVPGGMPPSKSWIGWNILEFKN